MKRETIIKRRNELLKEKKKEVLRYYSQVI